MLVYSKCKVLATNASRLQQTKQSEAVGSLLDVVCLVETGLMALPGTHLRYRARNSTVLLKLHFSKNKWNNFASQRQYSVVESLFSRVEASQHPTFSDRLWSMVTYTYTRFCRGTEKIKILSDGYITFSAQREYFTETVGEWKGYDGSMLDISPKYSFPHMVWISDLQRCDFTCLPLLPSTAIVPE